MNNVSIIICRFIIYAIINYSVCCTGPYLLVSVAFEHPNAITSPCNIAFVQFHYLFMSVIYSSMSQHAKCKEYWNCTVWYFLLYSWLYPPAICWLWGNVMSNLKWVVIMYLSWSPVVTREKFYLPVVAMASLTARFPCQPLDEVCRIVYFLLSSCQVLFYWLLLPGSQRKHCLGLYLFLYTKRKTME